MTGFAAGVLAGVIGTFIGSTLLLLGPPHHRRARPLALAAAGRPVIAHRAVLGRCPACGQPKLAVTPRGAIVCVDPACTRPTAAAELLAAPETGHVVQLDEEGFTLQHPLLERLDDALLRCRLHQRIANDPAPGPWRGRHRVTETAWGLVFHPLDRQE